MSAILISLFVIAAISLPAHKVLTRLSPAPSRLPPPQCSTLRPTPARHPPRAVHGARSGMRYSVPEISWHNRDPVLSADFQPRRPAPEPRRLATAGTDTHVLIWYMTISESGAVSLEVAADLTRHQKAVNVVRWSPSGEFLASGDDESIIFIWKQRTDKDPPPLFDQTDEQDKETWIIHKTLRGHMEDVLDISWDLTSTRLASGSVDNKMLCWEVNKGRSTAILGDHKGFVQGVAWDPKNQYLASISTDRVFRTFDINTKKVVSRSSKAILPVPESHSLYNQSVRLYYDDTLQTYFRRLHFSPNGMLIAVPSGHIEPEQAGQMKPMNAVYIYTRYSLKMPACILPCGDTTALVVRWSPVTYRLRPGGPSPAFPLADSRMLLAVATKTTILLYDTQQKTPIAIISNIHYTRLTDLTWSFDGQILVASSTDGFCSVISFSENELGEPIVENIQPKEPLKDDEVHIAQATETVTSAEKSAETKKADKNNKLEAFMQFKAPSDKSNKNERSVATTEKNGKPTTIDLIDETAMAPWSDDSNSGIKSKVNPMDVDDESEDMKLVYEDSQNYKPSPPQEPSKSAGDHKTYVDVENKKKSSQGYVEKQQESEKMDVSSPKKVKLSESVSPKRTTENSAVKPVQNANTTPKAPRRVSFVTLSSPKNPKKKC